MLTHERELNEPVDLCDATGRRLNPEARGFSRRPLHRANLRGGWGRTKRWDYWAILTEGFAVSAVYADVDYIGIAGVWWCDLVTGQVGGHEVVVPLAHGLELPDQPGTAPLVFRGRGLDLEMSDDDAGTRIRAQWKERSGEAARLEATVMSPPGHESLNVVIPWSDTRFQFTSKHQARPASGSLVVGGDERSFGATHGNAWGVLDVGRGRWPYRTRWNWAGGAGPSVDGAHVVGLQLGGKWTDGTGFTENGVIVDGRLSKIGDELAWEYEWDEPLKPWRVSGAGGALELTLSPVHDKHSRTNALVLSTEVHQVFGTWSGTVVTDEGDALRIDGIPGFAEESRSRW